MTLEYSADALKVETFVPSDAVFILNRNKLGDTLTPDGYDEETDWRDLVCQFQGATIKRGSESQLLLSAPTVGTLSATVVQLPDQPDPTEIGTIMPNRKIRASRVDTGETIYTGQVEHIATSYDKAGNSFYQLTAADSVKSLVNTARYGAVTDGGQGYETWDNRLRRLAESANVGVADAEVPEQFAPVYTPNYATNVEPLVPGTSGIVVSSLTEAVSGGLDVRLRAQQTYTADGDIWTATTAKTNTVTLNGPFASIPSSIDAFHVDPDAGEVFELYISSGSIRLRYSGDNPFFNFIEGWVRQTATGLTIGRSYTTSQSWHVIKSTTPVPSDGNSFATQYNTFTATATTMYLWKYYSFNVADTNTHSVSVFGSTSSLNVSYFNCLSAVRALSNGVRSVYAAVAVETVSGTDRLKAYGIDGQTLQIMFPVTGNVSGDSYKFIGKLGTTNWSHSAWDGAWNTSTTPPASGWAQIPDPPRTVSGTTGNYWVRAPGADAASSTPISRIARERRRATYNISGTWGVRIAFPVDKTTVRHSVIGRINTLAASPSATVTIPGSGMTTRTVNATNPDPFINGTYFGEDVDGNPDVAWTPNSSVIHIDVQTTPGFSATLTGDTPSGDILRVTIPLALDPLRLFRDASTVLVQDVAYQSSLANHFTLVTNSVGAGWYVDKEGIVQFVMDPGNEVPVVHFSDNETNHEDPDHICVVECDATYSTQDVINVVTINNHGRDEAGNTLDTEHVYNNATSIQTWGASSASLDTALFEQLDIDAVAADIMNAHADPEFHIQSVTYDSLEHTETFELFDCIKITFKNQTGIYYITGVSHSVQSERWLTTLYVRKANE